MSFRAHITLELFHHISAIKRVIPASLSKVTKIQNSVNAKKSLAFAGGGTLSPLLWLVLMDQDKP